MGDETRASCDVAGAQGSQENCGPEVDHGDNAKTLKSAKPSFEAHQPSALSAYRGYELIRLHTPQALDRNGRPIGKAPKESGWRIVPALDAAEAVAHMVSGHNVGVRLRPTDLVLDVDPRNFTEGDDPLARLAKTLGVDLTAYPTVVTGAGGKHIYMTKSTDVTLVDTHPAYQGIEFKSLGRQVVAAGSVHPGGRAYRWDDDPLAVPLASVKAAPQDLIELASRPERVGGADVGGRSPEQLAAMLDGLDPTNFNDNESWLALMMACHHATGGEGRSEFVSWSIGDPAYADREAEIGRRWDSLHADQNGRRVTERTLFKALTGANRGDLIPKDDPSQDFVGEQLDLSDGLGNENGPLAEMNAAHFTVLTGGKYLVGRENRNHITGQVEVEWYPDHAIAKHFDRRMVEIGDGKLMPIGKWWISHRDRRRYDAVVFDPSPKGCPDNLYNLWRGWAVEPKLGDWSHLKRLLRDVLCAGDEASFDYALKWAAFMVQHPELPAEVALVFKGTKGVGKGTFARALKSLAGKHGKQVAQTKHFLGNFNEHLIDAIFLLVDEAIWAGSKKDEGQLKSLITEPEQTFEGKGKPLISGPNHLHIVITSNERWVVPATPDERRFAVFDADTAAWKALPPDFFDVLNKQMETGGLAAMLYELLAVDLADWHPRKSIPITKALADQKVQGFRSDPLAFWWHRKLEDGQCGLVLDGDAWARSGVDVVPSGKDELLEDLHQTAKSMGMRSDLSKTALARFLGQLGVDVGKKNSKGQPIWQLPPLRECRVRFNAWVGSLLDWDGC